VVQLLALPVSLAPAVQTDNSIFRPLVVFVNIWTYLLSDVRIMPKLICGQT
jgi:hypothetical protein